MSVVKVDTLKQRCGSNFTEPEKCGFKDPKKHDEALDNALEQKLLEMNVAVLSVLLETTMEQGDTSMRKDALRRTQGTSEIRNIMDGGAPKDINE